MRSSKKYFAVSRNFERMASIECGGNFAQMACDGMDTGANVEIIKGATMTMTHIIH